MIEILHIYSFFYTYMLHVLKNIFQSVYLIS